MGNCQSVSKIAKASLEEHDARDKAKKRLTTPSKSSFPTFGLEDTHEAVRFLVRAHDIDFVGTNYWVVWNLLPSNYMHHHPSSYVVTYTGSGG